MKILIYLFIALSAVSVGAQKVNPETFKYKDGVDFTVVRIMTSKFKDYGNGNSENLHVAIKNSTFKSAIVEFKNTTGNEVTIDFEQFFLIDGNGEKHEVDSVVQTSGISTSAQNYQKVIKPNKTKSYKISFALPISKDELTNKMQVDGQIIEFSYKD